jgi:MFS family permease
VLEPVVTKLFFPASMAHSQLPFWIIFSVTFVSRPFGGLAFSAVADLYGRKPCLMASVVLMGATSVLIGCLPTYPMIGVAAPVLLALLRLLQGLALGGEYTAAVVTAYELAPPEGKNMGGAVAFAAGSIGNLLGVSVPMIVIACVTPEALLLWGWRIPFLVSVVTAGVALLLRTLMVEPDEFVEQQRRDLAAAAAAAAEGEEEEELGGGAGAGAGAGARGGLGGGGAEEAEALVGAKGQGAGGKAAAAAAAEEDGGGGGGGGLAPQPPPQRPPSCASETAPLASVAVRAGALPSSSGGAAAEAAAAVRGEIGAKGAAAAAARHDAASLSDPAVRRRRGRASSWAASLLPGRRCAAAAAEDGGDACPAPPAAAAAAAASPRPHPRRHPRGAHRALPVTTVFRHHWHKVLLQCLYTAASTAGVFVFSAWLPLVFLQPPVLLPRQAAYGTIILMVAVAMPAGLLAARACDKGLIRPVTLSMAAVAVAGAFTCAYFFAAMPSLASSPTTHVALVAATLAGILPHNVVYGSLANVMGRIYPPTLRVTGFSTGHNLASSIFGGFAPIIMQGLQGRWRWGGPAVYLASLCCVSIGAALLMVRLYPGMNALPVEAAAARAREREAAEAEEVEAGRRRRKVVGAAAGAAAAGEAAAAAGAPDKAAAAAV